MSMFANPVEHAKNPPSTWVVEKSVAGATTRWRLQTKTGEVIDTFPTKAKAEEAKTEGFFANLYEKESRWYAGEEIPGWKQYGVLVGSEGVDYDGPNMIPNEDEF